jgi:hypothetical protein
VHVSHHLARSIQSHSIDNCSGKVLRLEFRQPDHRIDSWKLALTARSEMPTPIISHPAYAGRPSCPVPVGSG